MTAEPFTSVGPRPWSGDAVGYAEGSAVRLAAHEPRVRAFTHLDRGALADAAAGAPRTTTDGPLAGMPVAVKEIIDVAAMPITHGSAVFADRVPTEDALAVARLRAAGAWVLGMTTTTPFACGTTTGTDNPLAPGHTPGGSSAGSGAAVGAGFVPVALGSQSQASTLRPASYCGAWGYKPTHGRLPREGMHLLADVLDDLGVIAADLPTLAAVASVLAGAPEADARAAATGRPSARSLARPLRIGRLRLDDGGLPTAATLAALDALVDRLRIVARPAGPGGPAVTVVEGTPELTAVDAALAGSGTTCFDLFAGQSAPTLARHLAAGEPDPRLREMVDHARTLGTDGLERALAERDRLRARWADLAEHHDVLLALTTTGPAPAGHATTGCRRLPATSSLLGIPALSAPWLTVDGRPVGVQLLGFEDRDDDLFDAAAVLAAALAPDPVPTAPPPPPTEEEP